MNRDIREIGIKIIEKLNQAGYKALFAGGCVRDEIMGLEPDDYDVVTDARPEEIMAIFAKTVAVGAQFGVVIVIMEGIQFEVATFRRDGRYIDGRRPESVSFSPSAREDARRRDFTINGLMFDPIREKLYDIVNGVEDIRSGVIRTIGNPTARFEEDKLRLMRAVRFATRFEFQIEENTLAAIKKLAPDIVEVSQERIRMELTKIITGKNPGTGLQLLHDTGLLAHILPEVSAMVNVWQPVEYHPEGDVFTHTKLALDNLEEPLPSLAFATLLHDVGKPSTFIVTDRIRFHQHAKVGAEIAGEICARLKFSNDERKQIVACVQNHMQFMDAHRMKKSTLKRMFQRETFPDELELHRADCLASHGDLKNWEFCLRKYDEYEPEEIKPEPLVTGYDLIALGCKPGPEFKEILTAVEEAQLEGQITTRKEALDFMTSEFSLL